VIKIRSVVRRFIYLLLISIIGCNDYSLSEEQAERFIHFYPVGAGDSEGYDVIQANDGGYYVVGTVEQEGNDNGYRDILLIKTDKYGIQESWSPVIYGTPGDDVIYRMIASAGDLILAGSSSLDGMTSGYCAKMRGSGQVTWEIIFDTESEVEINDVYPVSSDFVLTGYSRSSGQDKQVLVARIDQDGNKIWTRKIGLLNYDDEGEAIIENNNRLVVAASSSPVDQSGPSQILVLNTNSAGLGATEQRISDEHALFAKDLVANDEDEITVLGNQVNSETDDSGLFLFKFFLQGTSYEVITLLYSGEISYPELLHGEALILTGNNELAVCGWLIRPNDLDILVVHINNDFSLEGIKSFGDAGDQVSHGIALARNGRYIITGSTELAGIMTSTLVKIEPYELLY
jgi:hypothetical protein